MILKYSCKESNPATARRPAAPIVPNDKAIVSRTANTHHVRTLFRCDCDFSSANPRSIASLTDVPKVRIANRPTMTQRQRKEGKNKLRPSTKYSEWNTSRSYHFHRTIYPNDIIRITRLVFNQAGPDRNALQLCRIFHTNTRGIFLCFVRKPWLARGFVILYDVNSVFLNSHDSSKPLEKPKWIVPKNPLKYFKYPTFILVLPMLKRSAKLRFGWPLNFIPTQSLSMAT